MDKINAAPQRSTRDDFALAPQARQSKSGVDQRGSDQVKAEAGDTEFSKVTSKLKADQAIESKPDAETAVGFDELLAGVESLAEGQKVIADGQLGLELMIKQSGLQSQVAVLQVGGAKAAAVEDSAVVSQRPRISSTIQLHVEASATVQINSDREESTANPVAIKLDSIQLPKGKEKEDVTGLAGVSTQLVRREGTPYTLDRTVLKTTVQASTEKATTPHRVSSSLRPEAVKFQQSIEVAKPLDTDISEGAAIELRVSRQETHFDSLRPATVGLIPGQIAKEIQLHVQQGSGLTSADPASAGVQEPQTAELQPSLPRPTQPEMMKTLTIQLKPENLGTVVANLRIKGDVIQVELASAKSEVVQAMKQDRDVITEMLRSTGLVVKDDAVQIVEASHRSDGNRSNTANGGDAFVGTSTTDDERHTFNQSSDHRSPQEAERGLSPAQPKSSEQSVDGRSGIFV